MVKLLKCDFPPLLRFYMNSRLELLERHDTTVTLAIGEMEYEEDIIFFYGLDVIERVDGGYYVKLLVRGGNYRG